MTNTKTGLDKLRDQALRLLLAYHSATPDTRTPLLRQLATVIVDAREHFLNDAGDPDWKGLTYAYRQWLHDLYDAGHFDKDERTTVQASVRYHLGAVLRERLSDDELTELGMMKETPKERSKERRTNRTALLNALTAGSMPQGDVLAISAVYSMLASVTGDAFAAMNERDREVLDSSLADIERRVKALRRRLHAGE